MGSIGEEDQRLLLAAAVKQAGYAAGDLWLRFFAIGGSIGEYEVDAYLNGLIHLPALQRDLLAHAANELIDELPPPLQAPYSDDAENGIEAGDGDSGARSRSLGDQRSDVWNVDARKLESADGDPEQGTLGNR